MDFQPPSRDIALVSGFPEVGKWMIASDLTYADWLRATYMGKQLREPINVIIIDALASAPEEAVRRLVEACASAGYVSRSGHSGGYFGWLGGRLFPQVPPEKHHALANEPFELHNNHGRFFGPCSWNGHFYWIGAVSREKLDLTSRAKHDFVSFNQAREGFAKALAEKAGFEVTSFLKLENAIRDDPRVCTGDHDGSAVVLTATR